MSNPKITDEGVARLPLADGRAELLEEIMTLPTTETPHDDELAEARARRRHRWAPLAVAAAAAVAIGGGVAVPRLLDDDPAVRDAPPASAPTAGEVAVLDAPGWTLQNASVDPEYGGELSYYADDQAIDATPDDDWGVSLDIDWRPADTYDSYVQDRNDLGKPDQITVLGEPALTWAYSSDDHTAIRDVVGDWTVEVRGSGMDQADFRALLDQLTPITLADLDANLPASFVTDAERPGVIADMLDPIPVPESFDPSTIRSTEIDRYQLGADVTSAVACAWIGEYADALAAHDVAAEQAAADAMGTSRDWPILREMQQGGDWSSVIWGMARHMEAGDPVSDWAGGIGCN